MNDKACKGSRAEEGGRMKVKDFLAAVYRCGTCRHHLGFSETCVEKVRGEGREGECHAEDAPCDKWAPVEAGPYAGVSPVVCAFAQRLAREVEAFDHEVWAEAWLIHKSFTDGRVAQKVDRQNAEGEEAGHE